MIFEPLVTQVAPTVVKWVIGLILTGLIGVFMYPFRRARAEWIALKEEQGKIHAELVTQRNNCLATLQSFPQSRCTRGGATGPVHWLQGAP